MDRLAVCLDDAEQARHLLMPLVAHADDRMACWLIVCPPGLGHRVGRWLSDAQRRRWRDDWAARLRERLEPELAQVAPAARFEWVTAHGPVSQVLRSLRQQQGVDLRLLDARRNKLGATSEPMAAGPQPSPRPLTAPVAVASSLSLLLALTD